MGSISEPALSSPPPARPSLPRDKSSSAIVYSRDFAYADNGPVVVVPTRMAREDILTASAKTFAELLSGPTVEIFVGPERRQWSLHRNLLCHHSSSFKTEFDESHALKKLGFEGNKLELSDDDPVGFELLVKWLYQGQLQDAAQLPDEVKYDYAVACHKLYLLCDKFDMVKLQNLAIDHYRQCLNECQLVPDAEEINDIYRASPVGSPFRTLMIQIAARQIMDPDTDRDAEGYRKCFESNPDFAVEMVNAIRYMSGGMLFEDPTSGDRCVYHDHNEISECSLQGKGKGKAKPQTKSGAMNGEGHTATSPNLERDSPAHTAMPMIAELSSEKRTPRKLKTPSRPSPLAVRDAASMPLSSLAQGNMLSPKTQSPIANQGARRLSREEVDAIDEAQSQPAITLRSPPRKLDIRNIARAVCDPMQNDHEIARSFRLIVPAHSRIAQRSPVLSPTPNKSRTTRHPVAKATNGVMPTRLVAPRRPPTKGDTAPSASESSSSTSRKRKLADRTPNSTGKKVYDNEHSTQNQKGQSIATPTRPGFGRSGTSASSTASKGVSVTSGPRKLSRISSVVRRQNGNDGSLSIDGRSETLSRQTKSVASGGKRRPPKLRIIKASDGTDS